MEPDGRSDGDTEPNSPMEEDGPATSWLLPLEVNTSSTFSAAAAVLRVKRSLEDAERVGRDLGG